MQHDGGGMAIQSSEPQGEHVHTVDVRDLPVAAFAVDESHHVVAWNDAAERLLETQSGATKRFKLSLVATHSISGRTRIMHVLVDPFERHPLVNVGLPSAREDDP